MEGYQVVTSDDHKLGQVVGREGDTLIIEHGLLRKTRHALPLTFAHVDEGERVVHTTLSKTMIEESPKVDHGHVDEQAVAVYYGLAEGDAAAPTEGYGELTPDDPARTAEEQEERDGLMAAPKQRARIREGLTGDQTYGPRGRQIIPPNPHEVGGRPVDSGD